MPERRYLNAREAAKYLGFGEDNKAINVIYQWVHRGKIPYTKVGRTLRFDIQVLDQWMEEHADTTSAGKAWEWVPNQWRRS